MADEQNPLIEGFFSTFQVPPRLNVTGWADEHRYLSSKGAAMPGKYRSSRTPYMREPMNALSALSPVQEVVLMAGAQTGKSESGNNWVGYVMDVAPGPMLLVQPTVDNAKRYSKQRIGPMIAETPRLASKVLENKSRDSSNTMLEKEFAGGILLLGGANSAAGLRSMPIRYLFADEISNWPPDVDGEGDPLELAMARTNTFGSRRKVFKCSTPSVAGVCRIEAEYLKTDQRRYFVPCPHCSHMHVLLWDNFVIPKDESGRYRPKDAYMACPDCGGVIEEYHKTAMLAGGEWRATCPENADPLRVGYHVSGLYSPVGWKAWADVAKDWIKAQGNPTKLKAFTNNVLAETWKEAGESVDETALMARREDYTPDTLPADVVLLTAGIDVQMDRVEVEIVGWGRGEESWSLDYRVLYGDTQQSGVWVELDLLLQTIYQYPCGVQLRVARACIDTGGGEGVTQAVYDYVKTRFHAGMPVLGIKGRPGDGIPVIGPPTHSNIGKIPLFPVGTFAAKDMVYGRLRIEEAGPGYCHFSTHHNSQQYFLMLTAEEVRTKVNKKGFPVREWHLPAGKRNEALDCRVYATAALHQMQVNLEQLADMMAGKWAPEPQGRRVRGEVTAEAA